MTNPPPEPELPDSAEFIVIGGGVTGLSVAYHLAKSGARDVLLLERNTLTSGTSWHAAGIVGPLRANINLTKLAIYGMELFRELEAETGQATGYAQTGGYWLAQTCERLEELKRIAGLGTLAGLTTRIVSPKDLTQEVPQLRTNDLDGALFVAEDGQVNPVDLCMAYAAGARSRGVRLVEKTSVRAIDRQGSQIHSVTLDSGQTISCRAAIICAGAWSNLLDGLPSPRHRLPLQSVEHMYIVSEPLTDAPTPFPILRDLDSRIYIKGDAGKLVLGGFEPNAKTWDPAGVNGDVPFLELPEDWEQFEPFMSAGLNRWPELADTGIQHFMNGPESFTPDTRQLMGPVPGTQNLYVAAGMNSIGIMSSAGVGRVMAEWMIDEAAPLDLTDIELARLDPVTSNRTFLAARVQESVADQFAMHWPLKQPETARNIKRTPFHHALGSAGGVFGAPAGWERPLWYAASKEEKKIAHSYHTQNWWPAGEREAHAARDSVALYDLTPFAKFDVVGSDALAFLQWIAVGNMDVAVGRTVYTPLLNARGGIESDVTVTRIAQNEFRITAPAVSRWRDLARLEILTVEAGANVHIVDRTTHESVLGIMGPEAEALLRSISDADLSQDHFPFATSRIIDVGMARARATRLSYVGESGWELTVGNDVALHCYECILEEGKQHGLQHAGLLSLDACRIEKAFRHWGHDIGPDDTPLEAGLGFTIAWNKETNTSDGFIGQDALAQQKDAGIRRTLVQCTLPEGEPLLLHDEPVYRDNKLVGQTTSGARGFRIGQHVCLAWINMEPGEKPSSVHDSNLTVDIAGKRYPLSPRRRPAYDPDGTRMRGTQREQA